MAKKKKEEGFDLYEWNIRKLKELEKGKYMGLTKRSYPSGISGVRTHKIRERKFYVPKWVWKIKDVSVLDDMIEYHERHLRFPNNEERILSKVHYLSYQSVKEVAKDTGIDYKNISRYLKKMEKKGLITLEPEYHMKRMKSGKLKTYHWKNVIATKKGKELYKQLFGKSY